MNNDQPEKKTLAPAIYDDPINGPAYRQRLAQEWALQDYLYGGIAGLREVAPGVWVMPSDGRAPLPSGNNTKCSICGQMFDGSRGRTVCADERRHAEIAATKGP